MTFKELLDSVNFDNVAPHIVRMYPDMKGSLGWFNLHFDILRHMKPEHCINANSDVCYISMEDWEDGTGLQLNAFPMEGDLWEHSLTKEQIIAPDVVNFYSHALQLLTLTFAKVLPTIFSVKNVERCKLFISFDTL